MKISRSSTVVSFIFFSEPTEKCTCSPISIIKVHDATELVIRKACENKKDFLIALCEGGHFEFDDFFDTEAWTDAMFALAEDGIKENGLGELVKTDLKDYGDPYPVIYNKRKILK